VEAVVVDNSNFRTKKSERYLKLVVTKPETGENFPTQGMADGT
jgi:hypothetical protein